jgi:hypothetical protein
MLPVVLGLLGAASPFIMDHITAERARIAEEVAHRASELQQAKDIFSTLNTGMDRLASLSKATMFGIVFRDLNDSTVGDPPFVAPNGGIQPGAKQPKPTSKGPTGEDVATYWTYKSDLLKWQSTTATGFALVTSYFGKESGDTFKTIENDLETLAGQIDAAFYRRETSADFIGDFQVDGKVPPDAKNDFRTKYFPIWTDMKMRLAALSQDMIKAIQAGTVGSLGLPKTNEAQEALKQLTPPEKTVEPATTP